MDQIKYKDVHTPLKLCYPNTLFGWGSEDQTTTGISFDAVTDRPKLVSYGGAIGIGDTIT